MKTFRFGVLICVFFVSASGGSIFAQGSLTPPGPPGMTMRSLDQVEPRIPISTLPFSINSSGSYFVTGNLTGVATLNGITINADGVTLDLRGFALTGIANSGTGVFVASGRKNAVVRNGTIRSWGGSGIDAGSASLCQFDNLRLTGNGATGLRTGNNAIAKACTAGSNSATGFLTAIGTILSECVAVANGVNGIQTDERCLINHCVADSNLQDGMQINPGCTIIGSAALRNSSAGISASGAITVKDCTANGNQSSGIYAGNGSTVKDCTSQGNTGDGIAAGGTCQLVGNTCDGNGAGAGSGAGIHVIGDANRIEANSVTNNDRGIEASTGAARNIIVRNSAHANTTNYSIVANNIFAVIVDDTTSNTDTVSGNFAGGNLGTTQPWANISY